jgi:hypothetical protein
VTPQQPAFLQRLRLARGDAGPDAAWPFNLPFVQGLDLDVGRRL